MDTTMSEIISLRGTILPLSRRRRDALEAFARLEAEKAGKPPQTWVRETWDFTAAEAKEVLKANASEVLWERIIQHPNGGWKVMIPVMGSVIGQSLDDFVHSELQELQREAQEQQRRAQQLAIAEAILRGAPVVSVGAGSGTTGRRRHL
jgi:hypothetical protein